jgi:hypothetical protein
MAQGSPAQLIENPKSITGTILKVQGYGTA